MNNSMALTNIRRTISTLSLSLVLVPGLWGCDEASEEQTKKPRDRSKEMVQEQLKQKSKGMAAFSLISFNMQSNGQAVTLSDDSRDKILRITNSLCGFHKTNNTDPSKTRKAKVRELISNLAELGYKNVSLQIVKGHADKSEQKQEINVHIQNEQSSINCEQGTF